jgi:trans-2,3-dihydro-3-hydroxyanthranilate isomerase
MDYEFHIADIFTTNMFGGNQLAVLPDARGLTDAQMQQVAREFNFSETTFVLPPENPANTRKVRIFTPGSELPFAGHPTVGTAHVLAHTGAIELDGDETRIVLEEGVGPVPVVVRSREGKPHFCQLTAAKIPEKGPVRYDAATIAAVLSLTPDELDVGGPYAIEAVSAGVPFLFVPVRDIEALRRARVDPAAFEKAADATWANGIFVFTEDGESKERNGAVNGEGVMRARMFAPSFGIVEDPATGGAAAAFGGYLAWRSAKRDGTLRYTVHQGVEMGRPSLMEVETDVSSGMVSAVRVGGGSVMVASGTLTVQ